MLTENRHFFVLLRIDAFIYILCYQWDMLTVLENIFVQSQTNMEKLQGHLHMCTHKFTEYVFAIQGEMCPHHKLAM